MLLVSYEELNGFYLIEVANLITYFMAPQITVITINLNNFEGLNRTIKSVARQKTQLVEYAVVDGVSSDESISCIKKYYEEQVIDSYIVEEDNGIYEAMNKGLNISKGKYLLFLNSGDELKINAINFYINELSKDSGQTHIYFGNMDLFNLSYKSSYTLKPTLWLLPFRMSIFHPSSIVKRETFIDLGGFNEDFKLAGDYAFFLKAYKLGYRFKYINESLSIYESGGFSSKNPELSLKEGMAIRLSELNFLSGRLLNIIYFLRFYSLKLLSKIKRGIWFV